MKWPEIYLLCFAIGTIWSLASLLLGGLHVGHSGFGHSGPAHAGHGLSHIGHGHAGHADVGSWIGSVVNPSCIAVFLAWSGGVGYLLTRHSGLSFWINLILALATGVAGAWILAKFLRFLQLREQPLDAGDYDMVGVLGRVSCAIRPDGVGEILYVRDGARRAIPARSEDGQGIRRDEEVIVTRYEKGIAYVRTWEAMTQHQSSQKETEHVE